MSGVSIVKNPTDTASEVFTTTKSPAVPREFTGERQVNSLQENLIQATLAARSLAPEGEILFEDVSFTASVNKVLNHQLGRAYRDFIVSRTRGTHPVSIVEVAQGDTELDKRQITLVANTNCTANVRVR